MKKNIFISAITATAILSTSAFAYTYNVKEGWNLLGATDNISSLKSFSENGSIIWTYNEAWVEVDLNSNSAIDKGNGFWFKSDSEISFESEVSETSEPEPTPINSIAVGEPTSDGSSNTELTFRVVDTNQVNCFDSNGVATSCSGSGQDGDYSNNIPSYTKNSDGTVTDNITGIIWQNTSDTNGDGVINVSDKMSQSNANSYCENLTLANQSDWRLPDIKTMYSLIDFSGKDASGYDGTDTSSLTPFIDNNTFEFGYGDTDANERIIDAQWATTTNYVSTTMNGDATMFGVNLADGRIKGYPLQMRNEDKLFYVQCVRENESYGKNSFVDNSNDTISDTASGLMWQKDDSGSTMNWDGAISYCEDLTLADSSDWRVPNAKELQSIVDYSKSPDTTNSPAIDTDFFNSTAITNEGGVSDYGFYWSNTTHIKYNDMGDSGVYLSFGRALGYMNSEWLDVHGAGAQRSDPKILSSNLDQGYQSVTIYNGDSAIAHGPQGDIVRGENFVRCVKDIK